jgi:hypothetical protein
MGDTREKPGAGENPYIWLRYTTQFTTGGRTHTIEMGIPMPLGASAEMREQLIREAEAGMDQLSRHVENRVTQMLQRNARPEPRQPIPQAISSPPPSLSSSRPPAQGASTIATPPASSSPVPARNDMQPPSSPPAVRPNTNVGASMPLSPNMPGEAGGNIKLSQFMHYIREAWSLTPKQAMELLQVKTLNGLNYREALKQLQPLVAGNQDSAAASTGNVRDIKSAPQGAAGNRASQGNGSNLTPAPGANVGSQSRAPTERETTPRRDLKDVKEVAPSPAGSTTPQITFHPPDGTPRSQASSPQQGSVKEVKEAPQAPPKASTPTNATGSSKLPIIPISSGMVRDAHQPYRFDEEDDSELEVDEMDERDGEDSDTEQQQIMARIKLDELKEVRGSSAASPGRLTVLQNLTSSQISETQLHQLIRAAWGVTSPKKLKVDQVEALISWAKEDLFVEEVEAVLALIAEEDSYARSDW